MWWSQFCAFCTLKGILDALYKKFDLKLPAKEDDVLDQTNSTEKEQIKARELNAQAMTTMRLLNVAVEQFLKYTYITTMPTTVPKQQHDNMVIPHQCLVTYSHQSLNADSEQE